MPEGGFSVRPSGLRSEYVAPVVSIVEMDAAQLVVTLVGLALIVGILLYFFGPRRT